jgi:hypothetical protein
MVAFFRGRRATVPGAGARRPWVFQAPLVVALALGLAGAGAIAGAQAGIVPGDGPDPSAEGSGPPPAREALRLQKAQAWEKLDGRQRRALFASLRTIETRDASARLALLASAEQCLVRARGVAAIQACQEQEHGRRRSLKQAHHASIEALMRGYGLPLPPHPRRNGWRQGRPGQGDSLRQGAPAVPLR